MTVSAVLAKCDAVNPTVNPTIVVSLKGQAIGSWPLEKGSTLIGRGDSCDIRIDCPTVSKVHAQVYMMAGGFHLIDLNSRNGTFVNAKKISNHPLRHGDVATIGRYQLQFLDERAPTGEFRTFLTKA